MKKQHQKTLQKSKKLFYVRGYYYNPKRDVYQIFHDFVEAKDEKEAREMIIDLLSKVTDRNKIRIKEVTSYNLSEYLFGPEL